MSKAYIRARACVLQRVLGRRDTETDRQTDRQTDRHNGRQTHRHADAPTGQTDGQTATYSISLTLSTIRLFVSIRVFSCLFVSVRVCSYIPVLHASREGCLDNPEHVLCCRHTKDPGSIPMNGEVTRKALTFKHFKASFDTVSKAWRTSPMGYRVGVIGSRL